MRELLRDFEQQWTEKLKERIVASVAVESLFLSVIFCLSFWTHCIRIEARLIYLFNSWKRKRKENYHDCAILKKSLSGFWLKVISKNKNDENSSEGENEKTHSINQINRFIPMPKFPLTFRLFSQTWAEFHRRLLYRVIGECLGKKT